MKAASARTFTTASTSFKSICRRCGHGEPTPCSWRSISSSFMPPGQRSKCKASREGVAEKLLAYNWPGNVRELRNVIERAVALTRLDKLTLEDLPEKVRDFRSSQVVIGGSDPGELVPLEEVERRYILHVLECVQRQSHPGGQEARARSQDALSQAAAVRGAGGRRHLAPH